MIAEEEGKSGMSKIAEVLRKKRLEKIKSVYKRGVFSGESVYGNLSVM